MLKLYVLEEGDYVFSYINGVIKEIESNYIVVECSGIGYMVFVSNPYSFKIEETKKVYVYQVIREDENTLYGFKTKEDKDLFLKLISVKGLGPKMAIVMVTGDNKDNIYEAIEKGDINYLKKFPKIGDKVARQIILDLKGKLTSDSNTSKEDFKELTETLKSLGYKPLDIKRILPNIDRSKKLELQIKDALKLLLK